MINWKEIKIQNALAIVVILLCFAFFFYISSSKFPTALQNNISDLKIAMITMVTAIISYYFGASKSKPNEQQKT